MARERIECVGAVVLDDSGRLLLVRRGRAPGRGLWSVPGGKVARGEEQRAATAREVLEETGLVVEVGDVVGSLERPAPGGALFTIHDYRCHVPVGVDPAAVRAGDDAADVGWFSRDEMRDLGLTPDLLVLLEEWGVW